MTNERLDPELEDGIEPDDPSVSTDEQDEDEAPELASDADSPVGADPEEPEPMTAGADVDEDPTPPA